MIAVTPRRRNGVAKLKRAPVERALLERLAFERLLADLAARFADVPAGSILAEIERALQRLVDFFGYDRCTYSEFSADGALSVLCSAAVAGVPPQPLGPFGSEKTWVLDELRAGRLVILPALRQGFPPEAQVEAVSVRRDGLRSHLSIPLRVSGQVIGVLSFAAFRKARTWPADVITRLTIIGDVFVSTIARARFEAETQRLRNRLWHADRVARVGALTAAIAHELNQPLTAILSNAQAGLTYLGRGGGSPQEVRAILESVVRDDKRAAETIRTMRALLRQDETGRERMDLVAALREVLQLLAAEFGGQGIRVETEFGTGCWVMADKAQIEQVALNLMLNAAAAMDSCPRGDRVLRLSASRTGDGRVVAALRDSGTGIALEHLDAVFEPFWTTRKEGLGLGLAICRSIMEAHGGVIWVEPNPNRGVTFRFELKCVASAGDLRETHQPTGEVTREASAAESTVCVVDDDDAVRESLFRLLTGTGWMVASYASAREFLDRSSLANVACLLLDVRMPDMSGPELQEELLTRGAAPPIVFLSAHGDVATSVDAMKLGAVDFLLKPVANDVLIAAVCRALERHADERRRALERDVCVTRVERLSAREREIMEHVIRGRLNKQIAADLNIAEQTVKQHRGRVMEKMEVRSVPELVSVCQAAGFSRLSAHARPAPLGRTAGIAPK